MSTHRLGRVDGIRRGMLVGVCAAAISAHAHAQADYASDRSRGAAIEPAAEQGARLDEIVVTARKVEENLQDVPVAVTAFTGEQIERQTARVVMDVARLTPSLTIRAGTNNASGSTFSIRGQVQTDTLATLDPSVGLYVDGMYWARAYGINSDLLDLRSVQTLKGPQGTLFGRNTTGGAILIETNDPSLDEFSGMISATYGRFDERRGAVVLNLPVESEKFAIRAAFQVNKRDGYISNLQDNQKYGELDSYTGRLKFLLRPNERLGIQVSAEMFEMDIRQRPYRIAQVSPNLGALQAGLESGAATSAAATPLGVARITDIINQIKDRDLVDINDPALSKARTHTVGSTVTYDTSFGAIKFIGGYRDVQGNAPRLELDGTPFSILNASARQRLDQYSGELQVTGRAFERLDFASGLFYFHEDGTDESQSQALRALNPNSNIFAGTIDNDSRGVYGQGSWRITDALSITAGLRYSKETKGLVIRNRNSLGVCTVAGASPNDCSVSRRDSFSGWSHTLGVDYKITPDVLVYLKTSKGFRSGGQNLRATATTNFIPFGPEVAYSHEAGIKSEFLDRRARLNVAGYYTRVNDIQRTVLTPTNPPATLVQNAGKTRVYGGEAELTFAVAKGVEISATGAVIRPKYLEYMDGLKDRRSDRFETVPRETFTLAANYTTDIGVGVLFLRADYAWNSRYDLASYNEPTDPLNGAIIAATSTPAGGTLNARASVKLRDGGFELAAYMRNITNNRDVDAALLLTPGPTGLGYVANLRREPRTFGVTATYRFSQ